MRSRPCISFVALTLMCSMGSGCGAHVSDLLDNQEAAFVVADKANMHRLYQCLVAYKSRFGHYPKVGGHKFLIELWVSGVVSHSAENLDMFFSPGRRDQDPHYQELRRKVDLGENPWPDLSAASSADTHYAGRAQAHRAGMENPGEAWIANDNEDGWSFRSGTVNALFGDGSVRTITYSELQQLNPAIGNFDRNNVLATCGANAALPALQKLEL